MMKPTRRQLRGLTLIELMIGLGICAVLMSLAVPSFQNYLQRNRLKAAAQGLELDFRDARYETARRGQVLHLAFRPGADWCYAITTRPDCDCQVQQACRLKAVRAGDLRGVQLTETTDVRFDPTTGNPDAGGSKAVWQIAGGEKLRVNMSPLGRPAVCALNGNLPPIPNC
jgi:type IV fimbrial biogenesis protein FimT